MIDFNFLQDTRSTNSYKRYVEAGVENQRIAINQAKADWENKGYKIGVQWLDGNIMFQEVIEGISAYKPDCELSFSYQGGRIKKRKYEVKVTDHEPSEFIHIKDYQIDQLFKGYSGSYLFYSTPTKYFTLSIHEIREKCEVVISDKIGGKRCYQIWTPVLASHWITYSKRLNLTLYPKI